MDIIHRTGRTITITTTETIEPEPPADFLADVATVLDGNDKLRSSEALHQLRTRWESTYGGWSAQQFAAVLEDHGVKVKKRSLDGQPGQRVILAADITTARSQRRESGQSPTGPS